MKRIYKILLCAVFIVTIVNSIFVISTKKQNNYYVGKIESIEKKDGITTVNISPIKSSRNFASEIKANHQIEYADNIGILGLKERDKEKKESYLGQLGESIANLKAGDSILFKATNYDKDNYKLKIDELAVDLTAEE